MANLQANTEVAKANSKGFVTDKVVTYNVIKEYEKYGCSFCLRLIDLNVLYDPSSAEVYSIMANSNENGQGLAFMPLVKATPPTTPLTADDATKGGETDVKDLLIRINDLGLPINMTVWLDEKSVEDIYTTAELRREYKTVWTAEITKAGYSAGYYYGGVASSSCSCESSDPSNSVLSVVDCGTTSASYRFKIITIGDNNNEACQIRWAYMGASS